jgi:CheY-like chemotaxis protein
MKKYLLFILAIILIYSPLGARDFMVEFLEENYKETTKAYSNDPVLYHSIQVNSKAGPKLLILTGDNLEYRKWLRYYIGGKKGLIVRVPDNENDKFISSKAYEIDVTSLHPVTESKWIQNSSAGTIEGNKHILVIDSNGKRSQMISTIILNMGYSARVYQDATQAIDSFKIQPEKFKMIIVNSKIPGMETQTFVDNILKIDHKIPILIQTGYRDEKTRNKFANKFASANSVVLKPVVLNDLQNTITKLVKEKE